MKRVSLAIVLVLSGCAATSQRARTEIDQSRIAHAKELSAKERAPLSFQRYEDARRAADHSPPESAERSDLRAEERLWLEVAIAQAERQQRSAQRLDEEAKLVALDGELLSLERERQGWAQEAELRAARALATEEARKALMRAAEKPAQRVKLPREDVKVAVDALLARAEFMALTLESLSDNTPGLPALRAKIAEADALLARDPDASLVRADQALFQGLALFAALRGQDGGPTQEEKASLAEDLRIAGTSPMRGDRGMSGVLEHAFANTAVSPAAERVIERLCQLTKGHARGPVVVGAQGKNAQQAEGRLRWVRERFQRAGCVGQRYAFAFTHTDGDALETTWLAY